MIEPALVAEDGASADAADNTDEAQEVAAPADAAQEADVSSAPDTEQSTHS
jgi:hypothetical protein